MSVELDSSEVRRLSADLGRLPDEAVKKVRATMSRAGVNLTARMRSEATGSARLRGVPASIGYDDVVGSGTVVGVDVGPEIGRAQGSLAWVGYDGTATSGPVFPDPQGALEDEATTLEQHILDAVADL
ncbi:hypothetical protein [Pseudokineococcus lusitanus]|uniref:HK97 gp10 family phage protein n=1 Tax=Pseudokineococcus lusitanus TaxID=763993 RepID=A0A3N1HU65_9ACTN|nr:hypothetical protein [Pseudokineococcus lusitanus]ROP45946.1 hypothetical protein EDC03_0562 [Pseudokineococcus lusitanus]